MVLHKYKIDVKLDLVFIILGQFLSIIYIDDYEFQITIVPISYKSITIDLLSLEHKVKYLKNYSYE